MENQQTCELGRVKVDSASVITVPGYAIE